MVQVPFDTIKALLNSIQYVKLHINDGNYQDMVVATKTWW